MPYMEGERDTNKHRHEYKPLYYKVSKRTLDEQRKRENAGKKGGDIEKGGAGVRERERDV